MNINTNSRFAINPTAIDIQRSKFDRSSRYKTTLNAGRLVPIYVDEALPGDTFQMDMAHVIRMSTSIHPTMDNSYLEVFAFSIPFRLVWEHWEEFNGENNDEWEQETEYEIPQITAPEGGWQKGTLADYMGLPIGIGNISVSALPFRAYTLVVKEWFRDQNLQKAPYISKDDTTQTGVNTDNYITDLQLGGMPFRVAKYHDYFTSALPEPQKGPEVMIPLGKSAPVYGNTQALGLSDGTYGYGMYVDTDGTLKMSHEDFGAKYGQSVTGSPLTIKQTVGLDIAKEKSGLITDLSDASGSTMNEFYQAVAIQKLYLTDARGGTRYREVLKAHFGVTSPDARQQIPEFLGGIKTPLNVDQVIQTSGTQTSEGTQTTPQGNVSGFTHSANRDGLFTKSFTEHEIIMVLAVVRTLHTYQQGINRMWSRRKRFDFYWPALANIGEQAILNKEIYAQGNNEDEEGFGYQEAWADYRYKPSQITGELRSTYAQTLDSWHYGDYYQSLPVLGSEWIKETEVNIDRTLAVQSSQADQFILDCAFKLECTRPMPVYSIPGIQTL